MNIEQENKLFIQNFGTNIAIGIEGKNPEEVFNLFWNWGATTGEMEQPSDHFGWFWTQPKRFEKTVKLILANRLLDKGLGQKGKKGGFKKELLDAMKAFFSQIRQDSFVPQAAPLFRHYSIGQAEGRGFDNNEKENSI